MSSLSKNGSYVFVGAPTEFGLFFFIKEMGRFFVLGKTNHSLKEIICASSGKMGKVKRVIGTHQEYDYRETVRFFEDEGFKKLDTHHYPNRLLSYGVLLVFKKE